MGLSWWHILIVLVVFVLLFGAGRISGLMGDVAKGLKSFKKAMADDEDAARPEPTHIEHEDARADRDAHRSGSRATKRGPRRTA
jgi:sec-independent protein translocase protein TatA